MTRMIGGNLPLFVAIEFVHEDFIYYLCDVELDNHLLTIKG